jgi:hypothetical protein
MKYYTYETNLSDRNKFTSSVETSFGNRRYFSSLDTEVYFGDRQVDEMVAIDFTIAEPKLPIYGYNSFYPNRIVSGRRTLQGTFAINFTNTMYLLNILNSIDDSIIANDYESFVYRCPEEDSTGLGIGNSPIFTKRFDITLSYGYGKSENPSYKGCYQTLVGVQIVDYRQALDTEGNPILDMYSFIAKDIRYPYTLNTGEETVSAASSGKDQQTKIDPRNVEGTTTEKTSPEFIIVDGNDNEDYQSALEQSHSNSEIDCFILTPNIQQGADGEYYFNLHTEVINNNTKDFRDVNISISDPDKDINLTLGLEDIKLGHTTYQLEGPDRDAAVKIFNQKKKDPEYQIRCDIEFSALMGDGVYQVLDLIANLKIGVDD